MKKLIKSLVLAALVGLGINAQAEIASFDIPKKIANQCSLVDSKARLNLDWFGDWEGYFETQLAIGVTVTGYGRIITKYGGRGISVTLQADYLDFGGECVFNNVTMKGVVFAVN